MTHGIFAAGLLWWHFTCEAMDYDASPDWYWTGP